MTLTRPFVATLAASFVFTMPCEVSLADNTTTDPAVLKAQTEQALAQARQATAEAQLATEKAKLGSISTPLPGGTVTATTLVIEGDILAYRAADSAAQKIVDAVIRTCPVGGTLTGGLACIAGKPTPEKVVIFSNKELNGLLVYQAFQAQSAVLLAQVSTLTNQPIPPLLSDKTPLICTSTPAKLIPPLLAVDVALQLAGLFKTDTTITGASVTLDDFAVASLVAEKLTEKGVLVAYPPSYYPNALTSIPPALQIYVTFKKIVASQLDLAAAATVIDLKKADITARAAKEPKCKDIFAADSATLDARKAQVAATQTAVSQVVTALTATDAQSGLSQIQTLALAEQLAEQFGGASILQLKSIAAGGDTKTKKNILYTSLSFGGGAILAYMMINPTGTIEHSGTVPVYGGFVDASDMK